MIFGSLNVDTEAVHTHRDSYLLDQISVVSVRRPFLAMGLLLAGGLALFAIGFGDLLFGGEQVLIWSFMIISLIAGWWIGQLQLLSRDLRGSELMGAVFGAYRVLNDKRRQIIKAKRSVQRYPGLNE